MNKILFILLLIVLAACSEESPEQRPVDVMEIRNIGLLSTSEYTIGKVIELQDNEAWYKFGERNILISCKARIKAGIDLQDLSADDIQVKGNRITIKLPPPKILSFDMDPNQIRTEMEDVNGFRRAFTQDEKNHILKLGEESIKANIEQTSIINHAQHNAEIFVENFYRELGYKTVDIEFRKIYFEEISSR